MFDVNDEQNSQHNHDQNLTHNVYAIGDVQGCYRSLRHLIRLIEDDHFRCKDPRPLSIWFAGDLLNRGPRSLETLRFVYRCRASHSVRLALGNHDIHTLKVAAGAGKRYEDDTIDSLLRSRDGDLLLDWLRHQSIAHSEHQVLMVHAGVYPQWKLADVMRLAAEVEGFLRADDFSDYLSFMRELYGETPLCWSESLVGMERIRCIVNAFTRMRFCKMDQSLDFSSKKKHPPKGSIPWFDHPIRQTKDQLLIFGHWSNMGLIHTPNLIGLDTGCVWGGMLTAIRLQDRRILQARAQENRS